MCSCARGSELWVTNNTGPTVPLSRTVLPGDFLKGGRFRAPETASPQAAGAAILCMISSSMAGAAFRRLNARDSSSFPRTPLRID